MTAVSITMTALGLFGLQLENWNYGYLIVSVIQTVLSVIIFINLSLWPGMKNMLLGGEGLFNTVLTGLGKVWLQTMPIANVAMAIRPYIPTGNG